MEHQLSARIRDRFVGAVAATLLLGVPLMAPPARLAAQVVRAPYGAIYFFGDSFTDTGNAVGLAALLGLPNPAPSPPYAAGRFSNGPVYSEFLAARLGVPASAAPAFLSPVGNNFAIGGATTGTQGANNTRSGIRVQVDTFKVIRGQAPLATNPLMVLFGGSNDIIAATSLPTPELRLAAIRLAAQNLTGSIETLATTYGARNFLVPLIPDVGAAPLFLNSPNAAIASSLTTTFNQLLGGGISTLNAQLGLQVATLDLNSLLFNIRADAATGGSRYGITNTTIPCFSPPPLGPVSCSTALFVDQLHPTTQVHALIADAAFNRLVLGQDITAVPEPATVVLMGVGLALTGLVLRRRRSLPAYATRRRSPSR